ncbi:MAG: PIN domain-containing protein [Verrucomicrobiae bacterium]|nr:PIN domain-containing protein [Verrucomicrobiae bacterium]
MICPDINLLLYATFSSCSQHGVAKAWWDGVLSGSLPVRIGHIVILGFIRISTHPKVFKTPLTLPQAIAVVDGWLSQPNVEMIAPATAHWDNLKMMLAAGTTGGNLTTDAHIAALAADFGLIIYSNDTDFGRFPGVKVINPV